MLSQLIQQVRKKGGAKAKKEDLGRSDVVAKATRELGQGLARSGVVNGRGR